jgi:hypothetical protein
MPTNLVAIPGSTVMVPVNIDTAHPDGSTGMVRAELALTFDPNVFEVSAADVQLGSVPEAGAGWHLQAQVNEATGQIGVWINSANAIESTTGGSLVTIAMHVRDNAPAGATGLSIVPWVNPTDSARSYQTSVGDAQSSFLLHPAVTPLGKEPGAPGSVMIADPLPLEGGSLTVASVPGTGPNVLAVIPAPSAIAMATVEQVFSGLQETAQLAQESAVMQPAAILTPESSESGRDHAIRDLALLQQATPGTSQASHASPDDMLAYLTQTTGRGLAGTADDQSADVKDEDYLAALERYFASDSI